MPKYDQETRARAMAMMAEKGAKATSDELHINVMTLYKWRREGQEDAPKAKAKAALEGMDALLNEDLAARDKRIADLEAENARLNETVKGLEERNTRFRAIIEALIR